MVFSVKMSPVVAIMVCLVAFKIPVKGEMVIVFIWFPFRVKLNRDHAIITSF